MPTLTKDQIRHEVINLQKTLQLLKRTFEEEDWTRYTSKDRNDKWLKSQSILTGISHCRGVLQNIPPSDYDYGLGDRRSMSGEQFHEDAKSTLDRIEREIVEIAEDLKPRARRPSPILPTVSRPFVPPEELHADQEEESHLAINENLIPVDESELKAQIDIHSSELLLGTGNSGEEDSDLPSTLPNRLANPTATLIPPSLSSSPVLTNGSSSSAHIPGPLQTSTSLHEELTAQLAQMATQLRRNAEQFGEALAKDEGVVKAAQEKLEWNYDEVSKERVRLRDHSVTSRGTTCFTLMAILVVIIAFFMTFLVIRVT